MSSTPAQLPGQREGTLTVTMDDGSTYQGQVAVASYGIDGIGSIKAVLWKHVKQVSYDHPLDHETYTVKF